MITTDLLVKLFNKRVQELAVLKGLTDEEKDRIVAVFEQALTNPYMDERQIYPRVIGDERI